MAACGVGGSACLLKLISYGDGHPSNDKVRRSMKFQQLRYLVAVHENGLNITAAARQLHTSQPGVSRQLKLLEEELGFQLFEREGRALTRTTDAGEEIISRAASILREMQNIRRTSRNCARRTAALCRSPPPIPRRAMYCRR